MPVYVSTTGSGSGTGAENDPFTFAQLVSGTTVWNAARTAGDSIVVLMDMYTTTTLWQLNAAAYGCTIASKSYGYNGGVTNTSTGCLIAQSPLTVATGVTLDGITLIGVSHALYVNTLYSAVDFTVKNCKLVASGSASNTIRWSNINATNFIFENNAIQQSSLNSTAFWVNAAGLTGGTIRNNTLTGTGGVPNIGTGRGVYLNAGDGVSVYGNTIDNFGVGVSCQTDSNLIYGNEIKNCNYKVPYAGGAAGGFGVMLTGSAASNVVAFNNFHDNYVHVQTECTSGLGGNRIVNNRFDRTMVNSIKLASSNSNASRVADLVSGNIIWQYPLSISVLGGTTEAGHGIALDQANQRGDVYDNIVFCPYLSDDTQCMSFADFDALSVGGNIYWTNVDAYYGKILALPDTDDFDQWIADLTASAGVTIVRDEMDLKGLSYSDARRMFSSGSGSSGGLLPSLIGSIIS